MKATIIATILIILLSISLSAQRTNVPELVVELTTCEPSFISVSGISKKLANEMNYIFVYSNSGYCYGSTFVYSDSIVITAMGNDDSTNINGFYQAEEMFVGIYDFQSEQFYKLHGKSFNYLTNKQVTLRWKSYAIFKYKIDSIGEQIKLNLK